MGGNYSPAGSNKSNRSGRNSITSNSSKSKVVVNKRAKPTFENIRKDKSPVANSKVS